MVKMPVLLPWKKLNVHFPTFLLSYLRQNITRQPSHLRNLTRETVLVVRWHLSTIGGTYCGIPATYFQIPASFREIPATYSDGKSTQMGRFFLCSFS